MLLTATHEAKEKDITERADHELKKHWFLAFLTNPSSVAVYRSHLSFLLKPVEHLPFEKICLIDLNRNFGNAINANEQLQFDESSSETEM